MNVLFLITLCILKQNFVSCHFLNENVTKIAKLYFSDVLKLTRNLAILRQTEFGSITFLAKKSIFYMSNFFVLRIKMHEYYKLLLSCKSERQIRYNRKKLLELTKEIKNCCIIWFKQTKDIKKMHKTNFNIFGKEIYNFLFFDKICLNQLDAIIKNILFLVTKQHLIFHNNKSLILYEKNNFNFSSNKYDYMEFLYCILNKAKPMSNVRLRKLKNEWSKFTNTNPDILYKNSSLHEIFNYFLCEYVSNVYDKESITYWLRFKFDNITELNQRTEKELDCLKEHKSKEDYNFADDMTCYYRIYRLFHQHRENRFEKLLFEVKYFLNRYYSSDQPKRRLIKESNAFNKSFDTFENEITDLFTELGNLLIEISLIRTSRKNTILVKKLEKDSMGLFSFIIRVFFKLILDTLGYSRTTCLRPNIKDNLMFSKEELIILINRYDCSSYPKNFFMKIDEEDILKKNEKNELPLMFLLQIFEPLRNKSFLKTRDLMKFFNAIKNFFEEMKPLSICKDSLTGKILNILNHYNKIDKLMNDKLRSVIHFIFKLTDVKETRKNLNKIYFDTLNDYKLEIFNELSAVSKLSNIQSILNTEILLDYPENMVEYMSILSNTNINNLEIKLIYNVCRSIMENRYNSVDKALYTAELDYSIALLDNILVRDVKPLTKKMNNELIDLNYQMISNAKFINNYFMSNVVSDLEKLKYLFKVENKKLPLLQKQESFSNIEKVINKILLETNRIIYWSFEYNNIMDVKYVVFQNGVTAAINVLSKYITICRKCKGKYVTLTLHYLNHALEALKKLTSLKETIFILKSQMVTLNNEIKNYETKLSEDDLTLSGHIELINNFCLCLFE